MTGKILFVDDEENVLRGFERTFRSQFEMDTAVGAQQGLAAVAGRGPYAVVVSDLRMPGMDGIQFLSEVRKRSPDTVRLILSGNGDFDSVVAAVNEGNIFQFLTKPFPADQLRNTLNAALKQYQLITAERELLEETLNRSLGMMTEVLSIVNPTAFGRASRIRAYTRQMTDQLRLPNPWEFDLAAMLSQIGCIAVPPEILEKVDARMALSKEEQETFASHPSIGHSLISKIPRLGVVAEIVRHQMTPLHDLRNPAISDVVAVGAQMLMVAMCFDERVSRGGAPASALKYMRERAETYQASVVSAIETAVVSLVELAVRVVSLRDLKPGMIVQEDIRAKNGLFLVGKSQIISDALLARLNNFARTAGVVEPLFVLTPVAPAQVGREQVLREQLVQK
jgi:response regulator RpfG family c-di-GMP phosphodiesterase